MHTQQDALEILDEAMERVKGVFGEALINGYLYGSYARGDQDEESDVDILLTVDLTDEEIRKQSKAIVKLDSDLSLEHDITVCVTVKPYEQFIRFAEVSSFYKNVIDEGIKRCSANREVLKERKISEN